MRTVEALALIRSTWLSKISRRFARGEELRENFEQSLSQFFNLLQQSVETGDPAWLNPVLNEWVQSRTLTELDNPEANLPPILNQILQITIDICQEKLSEGDALEVMQDLLPVFLYASDFAMQKETALRIERIVDELQRANTTLERLDKSKSDFIAIAAHELKTPLTLIEGYAAMLWDQLSLQEEFDESKILIHGMENGTRRLREIVDDMIDVSLIDNNLLSINFQPIWINHLLEVIEQEFKDVAKERNQVLEINRFTGSDEMTFGDEERLVKAFRNIISNSVKYTPDGGKITIDGRLLPGFIEVTISDTGIGIDLEDQPLIFEKFGRLGSVSLHSSSKTKFKGGGPGLGLPITKGIIEAHSGSIWVESEGYDEVKCPGSTFHILLPIRKVPPDDKTAKLFQPLSDIEGTNDEDNY